MKHLPIIYVEDSFGDVELFRRALLQMRPRSELFHFRDAESAQRFLKEGERVDLVAVDINLPGLSGKELIRWIRQQEATRTVPIIALSGSQLAFKTVQEAEESGANIFRLKPPDYNGWIDLLYEIDDYLAAI
jgi:two-component system, chemotaxis family, response regulator Rcp1